MPLLETHTYIPQLFWLLISFILLYFLLSKFCVPQLTKIIELRNAKINGALEQARIMQEEAIKLRDDYEIKLAEAVKIRNATIANAMHELSIEIEKKTIEQDLHFNELMKIAEKKLQNFELNSRSSINDIAKETAKDILKDFLKIEANELFISQALKEAEKARGLHVN